MEWRDSEGIRWLEGRLSGAVVAFSTRAGGVSTGPYAGLNLGVHTGDRVASVVENRRRLTAAMGIDPDSVAVGRQVHGAKLARYRIPLKARPFAHPGDPVAEVDGHVTTEAELRPMVFVADCIPLALVGAGGAAMLHCGWRGLALGLVERGVEAVGATHAAIGPCIGPCCYEVGDEVLDAFSALGDGIAAGRMLDLTEVATRLLANAGVDRVEAAGLCTSCETELFFSHRRDKGRTGHQAGLVWLDEDHPTIAAD